MIFTAVKYCSILHGHVFVMQDVTLICCVNAQKHLLTKTYWVTGTGVVGHDSGGVFR